LSRTSSSTSSSSPSASLVPFSVSRSSISSPSDSLGAILQNAESERETCLSWSTTGRSTLLIIRYIALAEGSDGSRRSRAEAQCCTFISEPSPNSRRKSPYSFSSGLASRQSLDWTLPKVLDATLKEITAALLESDVNVKLVASLRQKVKAKVKAALDGNATDKETNRKNLVQKVSFN